MLSFQVLLAEETGHIRRSVKCQRSRGHFNWCTYNKTDQTGNLDEPERYSRHSIPHRSANQVGIEKCSWDRSPEMKAQSNGPCLCSVWRY